MDECFAFLSLQLNNFFNLVFFWKKKCFGISSTYTLFDLLQPLDGLLFFLTGFIWNVKGDLLLSTWKSLTVAWGRCECRTKTVYGYDSKCIIVDIWRKLPNKFNFSVCLHDNSHTVEWTLRSERFTRLCSRVKADLRSGTGFFDELSLLISPG